MTRLKALTIAFLSLLNPTIAQQEPLGIVPQSEISDSCHNACTALTSLLPTQTYYTTGPPPDFYTSYFSVQQQLTIPACIVRPATAQQVSEILNTVRDYGCQFAVKSGGHAMWKGASNIEGGVVVDLMNFDEIQVLDAGPAERDGFVEWEGDIGGLVTRVGTGNRWGRVYEVLEPKGLTVVGGRDSGVGVGGFLLGGGISFLSRRYGWAMDNVRNYELVLANGSITNVNHATHPDLYWALRGGGANFGIVTHFDLETFPQTEVWGGSNLFLLSDVAARQAALGITRPLSFSLTSLKEQLGRLLSKIGILLGYGTTVFEFVKALESIATESRGADPYSQLYMVVGYLPQLDSFLGTAYLVHSKPVADPPAFDDVKGLKAFYSSNRIANISSLVKEVHDQCATGKRWMWKGMTLRANAEFLSKVVDFFIEATEPIRHTPGLLTTFVMQPISQIALPGIKKNGGNAFGFSVDDRNIMMLSVTPQWSREEDDEAMHAAFGGFLDRAVVLAKELGLHHPFVYSNYANQTQDVFAGYGKKNRKRLRDIQKKYDPEGVFSKLQPGYFKL